LDLAISGGPKAIPDGLIKPWPWITDEDRAAVMAALEEVPPWRGPFPQIEAFEQEWAQYTGRKFCLALPSGSASLHAGLRGAGVVCGDEVIAPAFTYLGSVSGIVHANAIPVFVDVKPDTANIDPTKIEEKVTEKTRAIIVVDLHGLPADYDEIAAVAKRHGLAVVEDGAQAHGARYKGRLVGGLGDISGCSLNGSKPLSGLCEGGLLTTDDEEAMQRATRLKMFGEPATPENEGTQDAYAMGYTYRVDNLQAAFGRSQLRRLDETVAHRQANCERLMSKLQGVPGIEIPPMPDESTHAYFFLPFKIRPDQLGLDVQPAIFRETLSKILKVEGVNARRWQSATLPEMTMMAYKNAYGHGCPWSCPHANQIAEYNADEYPVARHWVEEALVVGHSTDGLGPPNGPELMDAYADGFEKVLVDNRDEFVKAVGEAEKETR